MQKKQLCRKQFRGSGKETQSSPRVGEGGRRWAKHVARGQIPQSSVRWERVSCYLRLRWAEVAIQNKTKQNKRIKRSVQNGER